MALMMDMQMRVDQWRVQIGQAVPGDFERVELLARLDALERLIQPTLPKLFRSAVEERRAAEQSMQPSDETSRRRELVPYPGTPLWDPSTVLTQQPLAREDHSCIADDQSEQTPLAKFRKRFRPL